MNYQESLAYIHSCSILGVKQGLQNIRALLNYMGNPQDRLKFIHVAGTNGKGSTVSYISNILIEAGYKTGVYTSPYLERFTERICINCNEVAQTDLARITTFVKTCVDSMVQEGHEHPTEFEIITAVGFQYFSEQKCDIVVLEVGLGGRLDATNVILTPLVAVITTINYDHMNYLGNTLEAIAGEKAAIIKAGGKVVLYPQSPEIEKVFENRCNSVGAELYKVEKEKLKIKKSQVEGQVFDYRELSDLSIKMVGRFQVINASTAIHTIQILKDLGWNISEKHISKGLENTNWPGRIEILRKNPELIIDGAHNAEGAKELTKTMEDHFKEKRIILVFGVLQDKAANEIIEILAPKVEEVLVVEPENKRAMSATEVTDIFKNNGVKAEVFNDTRSAVNEALSRAKKDGIVIVCGSLYLVGEVRSLYSS